MFAEKAYVACRLVAPSRACIAATSVLSISRLMGTPRSLSRVSDMSGVDSAEIDRLNRQIWVAPTLSCVVDTELISMIARGHRYRSRARGSR